MGLQYTVTDFKGEKVHVISSEGGVGRGLQPMTTILNKINNHQGGTKLTTYAPAYTFSTSERRGFVFNNNEIGHIDFKESNEAFSVLHWHASEVEMNVINGDSLKEVTSGISSIVGRMKALPAWT